jgi:hypothetical protein
VARRVIRTRAQLLEAPILKAKAEAEEKRKEALLLAELKEQERKKQAAAERIRRWQREADEAAERERNKPPSKEAQRVSEETGIDPREAEQLITLARGAIQQDAGRVRRDALRRQSSADARLAATALANAAAAIGGGAAGAAEQLRGLGQALARHPLDTPSTAPGEHTYEKLSVTSSATKASIEMERDDGVRVVINMNLQHYEMLERTGSFDPNHLFRLCHPGAEQGLKRGDTLTMELGDIVFGN